CRSPSLVLPDGHSDECRHDLRRLTWPIVAPPHGHLIRSRHPTENRRTLRRRERVRYTERHDLALCCAGYTDHHRAAGIRWCDSKVNTDIGRDMFSYSRSTPDRDTAPLVDTELARPADLKVHEQGLGCRASIGNVRE